MLVPIIPANSRLFQAVTETAMGTSAVFATTPTSGQLQRAMHRPPGVDTYTPTTMAFTSTTSTKATVFRSDAC